MTDANPKTGRQPTQGAYALTGIDRVTFAVADLPTAERYARDWGLSQASGADAVFQTVNGTEVEFVRADSTASPTGSSDGTGLRTITWGATDSNTLDSIAKNLRTDRAVSFDREGTLHSQDDLGFGIAFRTARRRPTIPTPSIFNQPGLPARIDQRAVSYARATPHEISHIALGVLNAGDASRFYIERLGFAVSDRYADRGVFLRCATPGNHHHLFLLNDREQRTRFNHLAFKVRDIHEVIGGGQAFEERGWTTFAGPGRHRVSSACFWYFQTPFGGAWEYAADEDMVTEHWEPSDFVAVADVFSEWRFGLERSDGRLRGPLSQSRDTTRSTP